MSAALHPAPLPPLPTPRGGACGALVDGRLLVIGGGLSATRHLARVDAGDLAGTAWTSCAPMPTARSNAAAALVGRTVVVVGGLVGEDGAEGAPCTVVEAYDADADRWRACAPMPMPRVRPGAAAAGGRLIVIGGRRAEADTASIAAYDPARDRWQELGATPYPARHLAAAELDGRVICTGGFRATPGGPGKGEFLAATYAVDPATGACIVLAPLPEPRTAHLLIPGRGFLYAVGGVDRDKRPITAIDRYDPRQDAWTRLPGVALAGARAMAVGAAHAGVIHLAAGWTRLFKEANPLCEAFAP